MGQIATNERLITLYCQAGSNKAKQTLAYAKSEGVPVLVIDLLKTQLSGTQLMEIADRLKIKLKDLIDQDSDLFNPKQPEVELSSQDWIKMIQMNPEIMKQPIALRGDQTVLVQTPTDILVI